MQTLIIPHETGQDPAAIADYIEMLLDDPRDVSAIVIREDGLLLDGHHRYYAAQECGVDLDVVVVPAVVYDSLEAAGFDSIDIVAAAHLRAGNDAEVNRLASQFAGADIVGRAQAALELWDSVC